MVSPLLAMGIGAGIGGLASGASMFGGGGGGQAEKLMKRQAATTKKIVNQVHLNTLPFMKAQDQALDRSSQFPSTVVPFSGDTQNAFNMLRGAAAQPTGAPQLRTLGMDTIGGKYLNPASNPFLAGTIEAATRPTLERLSEVALPGLQSAAISAGAYGGNRPEITGQGIVRDATREALDIANRVGFQNYSQERDRQMDAGNLLTTAAGLNILPAQHLLTVGGAQEAKQGEQLAENRQRFDAQTNAIAQKPIAGLSELMALMAGVPQVPITDRSLGAGQVFSNTLQGAIGGGLTGLSLSPVLAASMPAAQQATRYATRTTGPQGAGFSYPYFGGPR